MSSNKKTCEVEIGDIFCFISYRTNKNKEQVVDKEGEEKK
jgi:hypothetical protein